MSRDGPISATPAIAVSLLADGQESQWDAFVRAAPDATFCHLSGWKPVIERVFRHRTHYLMARRGDAVVGVLPLAHVRSLLFGNSLISTAFCMYGGPVAAEPAARVALEDRAAEISERVGAEYLEFRSREPSHPDWLQKRDVYATFRKEIQPEVEANLKAVPRKQRAMIRKGIALGLRSEIDADVERLHRIYAESVRNLGTPVFPKSLFRALKTQFGDACDIVTVMHGDEAVASVMNFYFREEVLPYYGGGTQRARAVAANDFMYWEVMRRACERGFRLFDFGRSKLGTGAYAFKKNWGFAAQPIVHEYQLKPGAAIPDINPLNPKYRLFIAAWKKLPLAVANVVGPLLALDLG
jgi:FemAB-related protein (PEP-CTERM system-associated)